MPRINLGLRLSIDTTGVWGCFNTEKTLFSVDAAFIVGRSRRLVKTKSTLESFEIKTKTRRPLFITFSSPLATNPLSSTWHTWSSSLKKAIASHRRQPPVGIQHYKNKRASWWAAWTIWTKLQFLATVRRQITMRAVPHLHRKATMERTLSVQTKTAVTWTKVNLSIRLTLARYLQRSAKRFSSTCSLFHHHSLVETLPNKIPIPVMT